MAIRNIVTGVDNETLRKTSRSVKNINKHIITLLDDMKETLHIEEGVGLAAPQVGVLRRIAVIEYDDQYYEIINPKIIESSGEAVEEEGCLSVLGVRGIVVRPEKIKVKYTDRDGNKFVQEISGILARVFCHEIDHLDGILFVDKMIEEVE
ncbi:MAG: peptide deformylase [Christensenellales bacterium]|jgi:peptide deformylase